MIVNAQFVLRVSIVFKVFRFIKHNPLNDILSSYSSALLAQA